MKRLFVFAMLLLIVFAYGCGKDKSSVDEGITDSGSTDKVAEGTEKDTDNEVIEGVMKDEVQEDIKEPDVVSDDIGKPAQDEQGMVDSQSAEKTLPLTEDKAIKELLEKGTKVNKLSFKPRTPQKGLVPDTYYWLGDKIKIKISKPNNYDKFTFFDNVYLDLTTKEAFAYCEEPNPLKCNDNEKRFDVKFEDYIIKLPTEWIYEFDSLKEVASEQIEGRRTIVAETEYEGKYARVAIDDYTGVPVQITIYKDDERTEKDIYSFSELSTTVKTSDVVYS